MYLKSYSTLISLHLNFRRADFRNCFEAADPIQDPSADFHAHPGLPSQTCPHPRPPISRFQSKTSNMPKSIKPLTSRPLDLLYYGFFIIHFICTILIDILPLWPSFLRTLPVSKQLFDMAKRVVDEYTVKTNDPFMLATWGLVQRDWEFLFMNVFMWMELYVPSVEKSLSF